MTAESLVQLYLFIEDCNLEDFTRLISYSLTIQFLENSIEYEFKQAKENTDKWLNKYSKTDIEKFVEFVEYIF